MKLKILFQERFTVAAVMDGDECPAELFITDGEASYQASREGLLNLLNRVAVNGLGALSSKLQHEVDKRNKIYEFVKGDLRLFYFKGQDDVLVVCTEGGLKKGQKVNHQAVSSAIAWQTAYRSAMASGAIEWHKDETEE